MIMRAKWVTLGGFAIAFANCVYGQPSQAASLLSNSGVECGFGTANVGKSCTMQELQGMGGATGTGSITIGDVKFNQFASDNGALGNTMSVAPFEVPSEPNLVGLYLYPTNPANNP